MVSTLVQLDVGGTVAAATVMFGGTGAAATVMFGGTVAARTGMGTAGMIKAPAVIEGAEMSFAANGILLALAIALGALVYGAGLFLIIVWALSGAGWRRLAKYFRAPGEPPGQLLVRETLMVGPVRYKWAARVVLSPHGLYLRVPLPWHPPLLIPWQAVTGLRPCTLQWLPAVRLSIGEPAISTLTFYARNLEALSQFLPGIGGPRAADL